MTVLSDMTMSEAASKALEVLLAGAYMERQERYKAKNSSLYDPRGTWQAALAEEYDYDEEDFQLLEDNSSAWSYVKYEVNETYTLDGLTAKREADYGGEGQGDQYWVVVSISDGLTTRYFKRNGWYASYNGGYLDGPTEEVKPKQKTITVYEDTL